MRAGTVPMEDDVVRPMQCDSHIPKTDVTSTNKNNKELWNLGNVLCGQWGDSDITLEDHIERLDEVFASMKRARLKCKPSKCEILKYSIKYLRRMVDNKVIRPDPDAVKAVLTLK